MIIAGLGLIGTGGSGTVSPSAPTYASTFTTALSPTSGQQGALSVFTVTPSSGGFPAGKTVQPSVTGFSTPPAQTTAAGSAAALNFNLTATGSAGTNAIVNVAIDSMTNQTGAHQFAIAQPVVIAPPTSAANKYFLVLDQVAVAPGDTVTGAAYPNGLWPTMSGRTITLSNGVVINLPTTGGAAATFSFPAGTAGEYSISSSNNAGLYDPYHAPLTVFAASSGTARTLSVALGAPPGVGIDNQPFHAPLDMTTFQRDTVTGRPKGFASSFNCGAGEVWLAISSLSGPTDGLFLQFYDAFSSGATATGGTGTQVTSGPVQVHGPITGTGTARVMLPAGAYMGLYADVATDAAMTNPVRIAQRFRVGEVMGLGTRSQRSGYVRSFPYGTQVPTGQTYAKTATLVSYDGRYGIPDGTAWYVQDGTHQDTNQYHGDYTSSGAQELGRLIEQEMGVCVGIAGAAGSSGGFDTFTNSDGTPSGGVIPALDYAVGGKFKWLFMCMGGLDNGTETVADDRARQNGFTAWIAANRPACDVIGWCHGQTGWFQNNGSSAVGHATVQQIARDLEASNLMVISLDDTIWNEYATSNAHASMASRPYYVQSDVRKLKARLLTVRGGTQTGDRSPTLAGSGTLSGVTARIPFKLNGASRLIFQGFNFNDPSSTVNTATGAEIASMFSAYAGAGSNYDSGPALPITSAAINTTSPPSGYDGTIDLMQASTPTGAITMY